MTSTRMESGSRTGWLFNYQPTTETVEDDEKSINGEGVSRAALILFFQDMSGDTFHVHLHYDPYLLVLAVEGHEREVELGLTSMFGQQLILQIVPIEKEDLDLVNHLSGKKRLYLKVIFRNVQDLIGYAFRMVILVATVAAMFQAHFNGLVLTIRNLLVVRDTPWALADPERYVMSWPQVAVFVVSQITIGMLYISIYFLLLHERGLHLLQQRKRHQPEVTASAAKREAGANDADVVDRESIGYTLGSIGQRNPRFRRAVVLVNQITTVMSLWFAVISIRRPVEGGVTLIANMLVCTYLSTFTLRFL